jgi:cation:H+ antiporter
MTPWLANQPIWLLLLAFAAASAVVWAAGTKISFYADRLCATTGISSGAMGLLLLSTVTSLPEMATSATAALTDRPALGINNLLGSIAANGAILALADIAIGRDALTSVVASGSVLLQATLSAVLIAVFVMGVLIGDNLVFGVGCWPTGILLLYVGSVWIASRHEREPSWLPREHARRAAKTEEIERQGAGVELSPRALVIRIAIAAALILVAGYVLTETGDGIAGQTGLGRNFVGVLLIALSTSLPEVSTVIASVRLHAYEMAMADVFGTNMINLVLLLAMDALYPGGPILNEVGAFAAVAGLIGICITLVYLAGLIERRDRTVGRMGYDSAAVLLIYIAGMVLLYATR